MKDNVFYNVQSHKTDNDTNVVANDFGEYAPTYIWKIDNYTYEIKMD